MSTVESAGSAVPATRFNNESDPLALAASCRPTAKLLDAGYPLNKIKYPQELCEGYIL